MGTHLPSIYHGQTDLYVPYSKIFYIDDDTNSVRIFHRRRHCVHWEAEDILQTCTSTIDLYLIIVRQYLPLPSLQIITERITLTSKTEPVQNHTPPAYSLSATYLQSASGGKSLLARGKSTELQSYASFFDENGVMDQVAFEQWVGALVEKIMEGRDT